MKKIGKKGWIGIGVVAVLIIAWFLLKGGKKEEKVSFETAKVEKKSIHTSITATGTIEPVTSVTVGTQVSGIVAKLYVDYNSIVKKGQVIAELDKTNLISELNTAKANLASSQSTALVSESPRRRECQAGERAEGRDQPRLCHHHLTYRRCGALQISRGRSDGGRFV